MSEVLAQVGWYWVPFLACSVTAVAVVLDRAWAIRGFRRSLARWESGGAEERFSRGVSIVLRGVPLDESWGPSIARGLARGLSTLSVVASVAPLIGLLGTATGMIRAFQQIQAVSAAGRSVSPGELAGGIWEALATTVIGLAIAIPAFVAHAALSGAADRALERCEDSVRGRAARRRAGGRAHASMAPSRGGAPVAPAAGDAGR